VNLATVQTLPLHSCFTISLHAFSSHKRSQGGQRGHVPPKFLENIVILCFERRFSQQNSVIRLKSSILAPTKFLGWLRHCQQRPKSPVQFWHFIIRGFIWVILGNLEIGKMSVS